MFDDGTGLACRDAIDTGECKMLNSLHVFDADMGMCRPTESRDCTGGDVFHINDCFANCPADFNDDDGDGVCDADIVQTLNCGTGAFLNSDNMCECTDDNDSLNADGLSCSARPPQTQPAAAAEESDDEGFPAEDALIAYGGVFGVVLAAHFLWDGDPNAFAFSPDVGYSLTESGYSYQLRADAWISTKTAGICIGRRGRRIRQRRLRAIFAIPAAAVMRRIFGRRHSPKMHRAKSWITIYRFRRITAKAFGSCRRFTDCIPVLKNRKTDEWKAKQRIR